jgi:hypothetical protein
MHGDAEPRVKIDEEFSSVRRMKAAMYAAVVVAWSACSPRRAGPGFR